MSFETNVPFNSLVVGEKYKFYFNHGDFVDNPIYATVHRKIRNPPQIILSDIMNSDTQIPIQPFYHSAMDWIDKSTSLDSDTKGGRRRRSRRVRRRRTRRVRKSRK